MPTDRTLRLPVFLLVSLLIPVAGCDSGETPPPEETPASVPDPADGLEVQFGVEAADYSPGDSIRAVIRIVNRASEPHTLRFTSSQRFDILVLDSAGTSVHSWSMERSFAQEMGEESLDPGEEVHYEAVVLAPTAPGSYTLRGVVTATGVELESNLPVEVE